MNKWKSAIPPYAVFNGKTYAEHNLYWRGYIANASSAIFRKSMVNAQNMEQCLQIATAATGCSGFIWQCRYIIERYEVLNYFRQHTQKVTVKAENNGGGKSEEIEIVRIMEQHLTHPSRYTKRCIRRGMLYNRNIAKTKHNRASKTAIMGTPP